MDPTAGGCTESSLSESIRVKEGHLFRRRERDRARRASETPEQKERRLRLRRERDRARRAAQSKEKRASILQRMRDYSEATMASEATEARELRLQRLTAIQQERLAVESAEERQARLQQLSSNQQERLARESEEARQARLVQLSVNQRERLAAESVREREARLKTDSEKHRQQRGEQPHLSLLEQPWVQQKMHTLHTHLATLYVSQCTTCSEGFPGLKLQSHTTECLRCCRDKHVPKLYSSTNNMDPGPVPAQLQVSHLATHFPTLAQLQIGTY